MHLSEKRDVKLRSTETRAHYQELIQPCSCPWNVLQSPQGELWRSTICPSKHVKSHVQGATDMSDITVVDGSCPVKQPHYEVNWEVPGFSAYPHRHPEMQICHRDLQSTHQSAGDGRSYGENDTKSNLLTRHNFMVCQTNKVWNNISLHKLLTILQVWVHTVPSALSFCGLSQTLQPSTACLWSKRQWEAWTQVHLHI